MQASKLKIGDVCAIKDDDDKLAAFEVGAVNTRRVGKHSADFTHTVEGWFLNERDHSRKSRELVRGIKPERLLGLYTEYKELVEEKAKADAERKREAAEQQRVVTELATLFYRWIDEPVPVRLDDYHNSIRTEYGHMIRIDNKGARRLLEVLKREFPMLKVVA